MRIEMNGKPIEEVDFGKVEIGGSATLVVQLVNESTNATAEEIVVGSESNEISISAPPKVLAPGKQADLTLVYTPSYELKQPLKANLLIKCKLIYYGGR